MFSVQCHVIVLVLPSGSVRKGNTCTRRILITAQKTEITQDFVEGFNQNKTVSVLHKKDKFPLGGYFSEMSR